MIGELARGWLAVGTQSVGGGASTLLLMRRMFVDRHRWIGPREFGEAWALSQLSPGIHLVALAGLLGRRVAGWRGVVVSVLGMMVPASLITVLLTVGYEAIAASPITRAALAGVAPVTAGMTIATALILVRSTMRHGRAHASIDVFLYTVALVAGLAGAPTLAVIVAGCAVGVIALGQERPTSREAPMG